MQPDELGDDTYVLPQEEKNRLFLRIGLVIFCLYIFIIFVRLFFYIPQGFLGPVSVQIEKGETVSSVAQKLRSSRVIKHPLLFKLLVKLRSPNHGVIAGDYILERGSLWSVVSKVIENPANRDLIRVTIPEGLTSKEISEILESKLEKFDSNNFKNITEGLEGYLFPDTYFFNKSATEEDVLDQLKKNFNNQMNSIKNDIDSSGKDFKDLIIMASLLEEEARTTETRKMVSGILWKRLSAGMPLQVDAVFPYIIGKNTFEITLKDLEFDSPYNTYKYKGLPPGPISNPGKDSILAAIYPTKSDYWFYLSDKNGLMHYAITFDEHKINKAKYLK